MDDVAIRRVTEADLADAERVRLACFPHVFDVAMGRGGEDRKVAALLGLRRCAPDPTDGSFVAVTSADAVVGYTGFKLDGMPPGPVSARFGAVFGALGPVRTARFVAVRRIAFLNHVAEPGEAYISDIAVRPDHRGRGIAARLVTAVEAHTAARGATRWVALVAEHNLASRVLMSRLGYTAGAIVEHAGRGRLMGEGVFVTYVKLA